MYVIYVLLSMLTGKTSLPPNQPNNLKMKLAIFWSWRSFKICDFKLFSVADPITVQGEQVKGSRLLFRDLGVLAAGMNLAL